MSQQPPTATDHDVAVRKSAIREGIRLERERVIRLLMSEGYRHLPGEDAAMVIHNGIHWGEL